MSGYSGSNGNTRAPRHSACSTKGRIVLAITLGSLPKKIYHDTGMVLACTEWHALQHTPESPD